MTDISNNVNETPGNYTEEKKPITQSQTSHDSIYITMP